MRITYRATPTKVYWENRWENIPIDAVAEKIDGYPIKYADLIVENDDGLILEAGCGAGRVLKYYHNKGNRIIGIDYIGSVIERLKKSTPELDVKSDDITNLSFDNGTFQYVLAFGLYHNLASTTDRNKAFQETFRVLMPGGKLCASFRADNIQTKLVDWLANRKNKGPKNVFHKVNYTMNEYAELIEQNGFELDDVIPVVNMPLLYKFRFFRHDTHKKFNESLGRKEGYRLNWFGSVLNSFLINFFDEQFCNLYVAICTKPKLQI